MKYNYITKYITPDLTECKTREEWEKWFMEEGNHDGIDGWKDFNSWLYDMVRKEDLIKVNAIAFMKVKPLSYDHEIPILIAYFPESAHNECYYSIEYDGGSYSGDLYDIEAEFIRLCGKPLNNFLNGSR